MYDKDEVIKQQAKEIARLQLAMRAWRANCIIVAFWLIVFFILKEVL